MNDTLGLILNSLQENKQNNLEVITQVNEFYDSAWLKLIGTGAVILTLIGVLVPYILNYLQKKTLKLSETQLENKIESDTLKIKNELLEEMNIALEKKFLEYEEKINNVDALAMAGIFQLQSRINFQNKLYKNSLIDICLACKYSIVCKDYRNLNNLLNSLIDEVLIMVSKDEVKSLIFTEQINFTILLDSLVNINNNGTFSDIIIKLKNAIDEKLNGNNSLIKYL